MNKSPLHRHPAAVRKPFAIVAAMFLAFMPITSHAGDYAEREIIGFSPDGSLFAFEEYGRQDGSGFPYSNIYVIDTATDSWTSGSPFRVLLEDEIMEIGDARREAANLGSTALAQDWQPGLIAATNRATEIAADPYRMVARPRLWVPPTEDRIEFRIETYPLPGESYCADFGATLGFRLVQVYNTPGRTTRLLHEDASIPSSRGCPLDYRFHDIVTYHPQDGSPPALAVLILVERVGFEGPDGRFMAVTAPLE